MSKLQEKMLSLSSLKGRAYRSFFESTGQSKAQQNSSFQKLAEIEKELTGSWDKLLLLEPSSPTYETDMSKLQGKMSSLSSAKGQLLKEALMAKTSSPSGSIEDRIKKLDPSSPNYQADLLRIQNQMHAQVSTMNYSPGMNDFDSTMNDFKSTMNDFRGEIDDNIDRAEQTLLNLDPTSPTFQVDILKHQQMVNHTAWAKNFADDLETTVHGRLKSTLDNRTMALSALFDAILDSSSLSD